MINFFQSWLGAARAEPKHPKHEDVYKSSLRVNGYRVSSRFRSGPAEPKHLKHEYTYDFKPRCQRLPTGRFYTYFIQNGQTLLGNDLDNSRYPSVKPKSIQEYIDSRDLRAKDKSSKNS